MMNLELLCNILANDKLNILPAIRYNYCEPCVVHCKQNIVYWSVPHVQQWSAH